MATLHRPANVDAPETAARLVAALRDAAARIPIVLPLHPRGRDSLTRAGIGRSRGSASIDPLGYIDFLALVRGASVVITDSGGIQEETTVLDVPVPDLASEHGAARSRSAMEQPPRDARELGDAVDSALRGDLKRRGDGPPLWDGHAGERIADILLADPDRGVAEPDIVRSGRSRARL